MKYTRKQILEAIRYWENVLAQMYESKSKIKSPNSEHEHELIDDAVAVFEQMLDETDEAIFKKSITADKTIVVISEKSGTGVITGFSQYADEYADLADHSIHTMFNFSQQHLHLKAGNL